MPWNTNGWKPDYVVDPTMEELENHVTDGLEFVAAHPETAEANMILLSAWNEYDEGHWVAPVLDKYGGAEKLEAIKRAIDKHATKASAPATTDVPSDGTKL